MVMGLFISLVFTFITFSFLRDTLNRYIYRYLLLILKNQKLTTYLFALLFLPGVALHEVSHWIMAKVLLVHTHHFSLVPEWVEDGTIRFGYVEMSKTDRLRSALIALAPLLSGVAIILWLAFNHLHLDVVLQGLIELNWDLVGEGLKIFFRTPDLFLWMYLLFTISNMMLPSPTDQKVWLPVGAIFAVLYITIVLISMESEASSWLVNLSQKIGETLLQAFGIATFQNLFLVVPLLLLERFLRRARRSLPSV
jgi:hypothetical protein